MGARWPWEAWCAKGHRSTGFSGGSDGVCNLGDCIEPIVRENQLPFGDEPQGVDIPDPLIVRLQEQQKQIEALTTAAEAMRAALEVAKQAFDNSFYNETTKFERLRTEFFYKVEPVIAAWREANGER